MSGLGIPDVPASTIESACASGSAAIREAWVNIGAGLYDCMLVVGVERISQLRHDNRHYILFVRL